MAADVRENALQRATKKPTRCIGTNIGITAARAGKRRACQTHRICRSTSPRRVPADRNRFVDEAHVEDNIGLGNEKPKSEVGGLKSDEVRIEVRSYPVFSDFRPPTSDFI